MASLTPGLTGSGSRCLVSELTQVGCDTISRYANRRVCAGDNCPNPVKRLRQGSASLFPQGGASALRDVVSAAAPATEPATPKPNDPEPAAPDPNLEVTVVPGVPRYHNARCILIRFMGENDLDKMTRAAARGAGCTPCRACLPDQPEKSAE